MDLGLRDRAAFIAGSSSGLGLASAVELARAGCRVAICSRRRDRIDAAGKHVQLEADVPADRVLPLVCDVTDEAQVAQAIAETVHDFGGLNILVTNSGGPRSGGFEEFGPDDYRTALELNLMSTIHLCRHAVPHLRRAAHEENGLARILMVTSMSVKQPVATLLLSNVSRAGVHGLAKSLAEELGPEGITVNTLLPGYTRTDRLSELATGINQKTGKSVEAVEAEWAAAGCLKRIGKPEEFAAAVVFLASARAGYITGVALPVDGGRSRGLL